MEDSKLHHVLVLFRHGDRSPVTEKCGSLTMLEPEKQFWTSLLPTPEMNHHASCMASIVGPTPSDLPGATRSATGITGRLTQLGAESMHNKGQVLRKQYATLVTSITSPSQVYIRSTNILRTLLTAQHVLRGLFPEWQAESPDKATLHIRTKEPMVLAPPYKEAGEVNPEECGFDLKSVEMQMRNIIGFSEDESIPWIFIREILVCRQAHKVPFPEGLTTELFDRVVEYNNFELRSIFSNPSSCQWRFNKGMREITDRMNQIHQGVIECGMSLFSVHDLSLVAFFYAMDLQIDSFPLYGSTVAMEFYTKENEPMQVRFVYEGCPVAVKGLEATETFLYPYSDILFIIDTFFQHQDQAPLTSTSIFIEHSY